MKMITVKDEFIIFDGENVLSFGDDREAAFAYVFLMMQIRPIPYTAPSLYPIRSLVPHPKKIKLTEAQTKKIKAIKQRISNKKYNI